jgi:hypothetical protein
MYERMTKMILIGLALIWSAANAFAGYEWVLVETSEALQKEIVLLEDSCSPSRLVQFHDNEPGVADWKRECSQDNRTLVKRLNKLAQGCDSFVAATKEFEESSWNDGLRLEARAARFYARVLKYLDSPELKKQLADKRRSGGWLAQAQELKAEIDALTKERARQLEADPNCTPAKAGLLSDESIEWLRLRFETQ